MIKDNLEELNTHVINCSGIMCGRCPAHVFIDGKKHCLQLVISSVLGEPITSAVYISPQEWLDELAYIFDINQNVKQSCSGVSCDECPVDKLDKFFGVSGCLQDIDRWLSKNSAYWRKEP